MAGFACPGQGSWATPQSNEQQTSSWGDWHDYAIDMDIVEDVESKHKYENTVVEGECLITGC